MAQLKSHASAFPIEDIGVAQGNSLSPLLGNLILYDFDLELNKDMDVRCIRYIDDFIIVAPTQQIAENTFAKAKHILKTLGMSISESKTQKADVKDGFEFLGIDLSNGFIRPTGKARQRLLASVTQTFSMSERAFREHAKSGQLARALSLLETLGKVGGIMQGWGKHYRFCNDSRCFEHLDEKITQLMRGYLGVYRDEREKLNDVGRWKLLGIEALAQIEREPFIWPKRERKPSRS